MKPERIAGWLPEVFQQTIEESNAMKAVLEVMATLVTPIEQHLDTLDATFDPYRTRRQFVSYLARWVDMDSLIGAPDGSSDDCAHLHLVSGTEWLREMVARASFFARQRGTADGLREFLETATGLAGFVVCETPQKRAFHIRIDAPAGAERYRGLIERIVALEKPAYVTGEVRYAERADPTKQDP